MRSESFKEKSYWLSSGDHAVGRLLQGDLSVDVAVIGGGYTGLSTAYHLKTAEPGVSIVLLEGQVIGYGGSGRNAGFSNTLFGVSLGLTALRFGKTNAKEAHQYMEQAVDTTRELVTTLGIDCDYEHPGFFLLATSPAYEKKIKHELEFALSLGIDGIEWLERDEVQLQVQSPLIRGAWWQPRCGLLNPAKLCWGWKRVLESLDVAIYENSPVTEIQPRDRHIRLQTPNGTVDAQKVVLATNAYSHLLPRLRWKQAPAWTHIVLTEPLTNEQLAAIGWQNRQGLEDARNLAHYFRLTADNRLLMGGRDITLGYGADMDRDRNDTTFAGLEQNVVEMFPSLRGVRFTHQWGGPVSLTLDMVPAVGYLGDKRMMYSLGYTGHGVSTGHMNGRLLADLLRDRQTGLSDLFFVNRTVLPLPPDPLRWLGIAAVRGFLRWQDRRNDPKSHQGS
ncbi:NAD(P)/FAD-dependent oxidoreductase [Myxococcota bacterium]